ncbi:hypothetical protein [Pedobacter cryophilus]|nr:hypothetical protein [Pedobacter cryophilus]
MKNTLKITSIFLFVFCLSACGVFKKGCQCPKFNQQIVPAKGIK